jgi:hypothetical protein
MASEAIIPVITGNSITAVLDTGFAWGMSMARSLRLVNIRIIGGWMIGTSDI